MNSVWVDLMGAEVKFYQGKKYRTRVIEAGSGEPLVLIHGVGGHAEAYSRNIMRLAQDFRVLAIDLIYHGYSSKEPQDGNTIANYCEQVIELLDVIGAEKAYVEGESLGGWIAMWLALHNPERLHKVILNTAAGVQFDEDKVVVDDKGGLNLLAERSIAAVNNPNPETIRKRLEWLMASPDRVTDEMVDIRLKIYSDPVTQKSLTHVFENSFGGGTTQKFYISEQRAGDIKVPALVLWSDKNPGTGPDAGERLAALIPGAEYYCINDAAHWPQWEQPEEHDRVVRDFCKAAVPA
ncbi:MAG: alpha/beta hydrolase [Dehalococcoidia bacterium]